MLRWLFLLALAFAMGTQVQAAKRIALTFDDVPRMQGAFFTPEERSAKLIAALRTAKVRQAAFFINPGRLANADGARGQQHIADYVAAGHVIANFDV